MKPVKLFYSYLLGPLALLALVLSAAVLFVASPVVWETFYQAPERVGELGYHDGVKIAKHLWDDTPYAEVSSQLKGGRLFKREVVHYEDLQDKFDQLKVLTVLCLLLVVPVAFLQKPRQVLWVSLGWLLGLSAVAAVWALQNWKHFFHTLHWWIFQDASWKLPRGCYSLQLYPYPVWKSACVVIVVFCILVYLALFAVSCCKGRRGAEGGSE